MARKKTKYTYVEILQNALGLSWNGKDFDVHHINGNHFDDNLENLIVLPQKLHRLYHKTLMEFNEHMQHLEFCGNSIEFSLGDIEETIDILKRFNEIKGDMAWIHYRQKCLINNRIQYGELDGHMLQYHLLKFSKKYETTR